MTSIRISQTDIDRIKTDLRHINEGMPTVVSRALNRTVVGIRTDMVAVTRREYNVKAKAVRQDISIVKSSKSSLSAMVVSKGTPIPLINFSPKPSTPSPRRKKPITVEVIRGERQPVKGAFVALMPKSNEQQKKQHTGVFWRKKKGDKVVGRYPISERWGPRIQDLYARSEIQLEIQTKADARLKKELEHETDFLFRKRMGLI